MQRLALRLALTLVAGAVGVGLVAWSMATHGMPANLVAIAAAILGVAMVYAAFPTPGQLAEERERAADR